MPFGAGTNVNLAGDGGGDQGGPAFLQQVDGALGFGGEGVELSGFTVKRSDDTALFVRRRYSDHEFHNCRLPMLTVEALAPSFEFNLPTEVLDPK